VLTVPGLLAGRYQVTTFDTEAARVESRFDASAEDGRLRFEVPVARDLAVVVRVAG
jgi:hypothetical protein